MTEAEWRACADPVAMLRWLGSRGDERQLRQFAVECCRRIEHLLVDRRSRRAVKIAERFVQGSVSAETLEKACDEAEDPYQEANLRAEDPDNPNPGADRVIEAAAYAAHQVAWPQCGWDTAVEVTSSVIEAVGGDPPPNAESAAHAEILRRLVPYPGE